MAITVSPARCFLQRAHLIRFLGPKGMYIYIETYEIQYIYIYIYISVVLLKRLASRNGLHVERAQVAVVLEKCHLSDWLILGLDQSGKAGAPRKLQRSGVSASMGLWRP